MATFWFARIPRPLVEAVGWRLLGAVEILKAPFWTPFTDGYQIGHLARPVDLRGGGMGNRAKGEVEPRPIESGSLAASAADGFIALGEKIPVANLF